MIRNIIKLFQKRDKHMIIFLIFLLIQLTLFIYYITLTEPLQTIEDCDNEGICFYENIYINNNLTKYSTNDTRIYKHIKEKKSDDQKVIKEVQEVIIFWQSKDKEQSNLTNLVLERMIGCEVRERFERVGNYRIEFVEDLERHLEMKDGELTLLRKMVCN
jgi:hypothetical protein